MSATYDVIIIGAGPAGYVAAIRAAQLGKTTAIIDRQWVGGVCLNVGCIPSKALLKSAEVARILRKGGQEFGFSFENLQLDFGAAVRRSRQVSRRLVKGVEFLLKKNGVRVCLGEGKVTGPRSLTVKDPLGGVETLRADNIIIATGASAAVPCGWNVDGERILSYREAIMQEKQPGSVIIIGGGAIGVEFATLWNSYGSEVTIVEMLPRLLPMEDPDIGDELEKSFKKKKIRILAGSRVERVEADNTGVGIEVSTAGDTRHIEADQILVAVGFRPNSSGLGLEQVGVRIDDGGFIGIDERMQTTVPGVYAIGDVTGKLMLAHAGSAMGMVAAEAIAGLQTSVLDYDAMPHATYSHPQAASFGLTEARAVEEGIRVRVGRFPFQANGKALGLGDYAGWVKLVVNEKDRTLLGASMIGPEVTELLPELTLARSAGMNIEAVARNIHAHPTVSEGLMEAAHAAEGRSIHL